jgi:hypothetical protein
LVKRTVPFVRPQARYYLRNYKNHGTIKTRNPDPMKDKPNHPRPALLWAKQQIRQARADYDARVAAAAALPLLRVPEPPQPAPEKQAQRRRCDARIKHNPAALDRAIRAGPAALRKYMRSSRCRNWSLPGGTRCRLHGGHSTGPLTPEGKAHTVAAMKAGRARWLANLKTEGKPIPCGRKKGGHNRTREEREQAAWHVQCRREADLLDRQVRIERRTKRAPTECQNGTAPDPN